VLLRAFLGATFLYAGVQKLLDPNFLHGGSPDFIGSQLQAFSRGSPIGALLQGLAPLAIAVGVGIAIAEIAIGLGTLGGVAPVTVAIGGFLINLTLTLSATWHVHPYFLGSDSIYAVAWLAYGMGVLETRRRARPAPPRKSEARARPDRSAGGLSRREFLRGAALAGGTLVTAAVAVALEGGPTVGRAFGAGGPSGPSASPSAPAATGSPAVQGPVGAGGSSTAAGSVPLQGTPIAELSSIPVGGAIPFEAPGIGAAALVRVAGDEVVAYSRICTHAGCEVGYDPSARLLVCPCHGAEFDPANGAEPVAGPARFPLRKVDVGVDSSGEIVLLT
ncbi:MAG TPA: Rieske 2Fe-2S domain-containing protein, partial [Actinomycetota bacterium]|nr:Rieske 2Fe-2S domain-containing protein [Actinomycetota bacterium]